MINFPVVDTHLHLWDPAQIRYPWLDDIDSLNRPFLLADYDLACGDTEVESMVFLQCEASPEQYLDELKWVNHLAENQDTRIRGIVPWAPLEKGDDARAELEVLASYPSVKGIRRIIQFEPDDDFCLQPAFVRGVQLLAEFDLHFEICIKGDVQFSNTIKLVEQCPYVTFILDHIGKPFIDKALLFPWADMIGSLANFDNTWCKLSGLVNEADMLSWKEADFIPYVDTVIDRFGADRVLFGSDWPVNTLAGGFQRWITALDSLLAGRPQIDRKKIFADNARAFYRL